MTIDELLELDDDAQIEYLNGQLDDGKSVDEICADLSTTRMDMARVGFFVVKNRFML